MSQVCFNFFVFSLAKFGVIKKGTPKVHVTLKDKKFKCDQNSFNKYFLPFSIHSSPETDQRTEARVALTTPEVVLNNEKDEEVQLKQQSQEKSPEDDEQDRNKMTMPNKLTHKSPRLSPQRLAKSKTAKFKLETKLKQAELALIQSQNQYDLCKIALCFLLLLYNVYSDIYTCVLPFFFSFSFSLSLCVFTLSLPFFSSGR